MTFHFKHAFLVYFLTISTLSNSVHESFAAENAVSAMGVSVPLTEQDIRAIEKAQGKHIKQKSVSYVQEKNPFKESSVVEKQKKSVNDNNHSIMGNVDAPYAVPVSSSSSSPSSVHKPYVSQQQNNDDFKQKEGYFSPLNSLLVKMLSTNPKIKADYQRFVAAREKYDETRRNVLPEAQANASYGYQRAQRGDFPREEYPEIAYGVTVVQDVYTGGRLEGERNKSRQQMDAALAEFDFKRNQEALRFLNIYIVLYTNLEEQKLSYKNIDVLHKSIDTIKYQIEAGETTEIDLHQAQARLKVEEATLEKLQAEYGTLNLRFKNLVGHFSSRHLEDPVDYCKVNGNREQLERIVLSNNPQLRAARLGIDIAETEIDLARATISPTVSLVARHTYNEGQSVFFPAQSTTSSASAQLVVPLFDKGMIYPRIRSAEANKKAASYDLRGRSMDVFEQFEEYFRMLTVLNKTINAQKSVIDATDKLFQATVAEHEIGFKTFYELLEIERDLVKAKSDYITSKAEYVFTGCRILALQGHLPVRPKKN